MARYTRSLQIFMTRTLSFITLLVLASATAHAATVLEAASGISLTVSPRGIYFISIQDSDWTFGGNVPGPLQELQQASGADGIGKYDEINFAFVDAGTPKQAGIRVYQQRPVVLFALTFPAGGTTGVTFPTLIHYPGGLYHLTSTGWEPHFDEFTTDGALVAFDSNTRTFIVSPASDFMVARTSFGAVLASGISPEIQQLPEGFTHQTMLVVDKGINQAFETWGHALTDLQGKVRPPNGADITLSHLGYWTDNGARYYYAFKHNLGYEDTLLAIRDEFQTKGVPLGYMQLDSWFYPKGPKANWKNGADGIYEYEAAPQLFKNGLKAFQQELDLPLMTHARWIDDDSPYRREYRMSNNVVIDPRYWNKIMSYLKDAGVTTYEQDWLATQAQTDFNLADPGAFLNEMAQAAAEQGLTMQYCQPLPRHYLQSSKYNNVTTIRTSPDRFSQAWWDRFLYGSRLASALGIWPWTDVFMSAETGNLLLATLSAGPVGVGDALGNVDSASLLLAVRKDGLIVKPDAALVPTDQTVLQDAQGFRTPMVAATYTDFGSMKAAYVFAHPRGVDTVVLFRPSSLGQSGEVYVYNYFTHAGQVMNSGDQFFDQIPGDFAYYIVTPIGPSGIGLLGDAGQFVSLGRQRITQVTDDGTMELTVAFAPGESSRIIQGYSPKPPVVTAQTGTVSSVSFDPAAQRFRFSVSTGADGTATVQIVGD
jgi:hypothetical protein